jgi:monofunctional biosynthetic peptidoglycan transglycosylase
MSTADLRRMRRLCFGLLLLATLAPALADESMVVDFSGDKARTLDWRIVNDGVMGGLSKGRHEMTEDGTMRFHGTLSLENNGGFSLVETGRIKRDLSAADALTLRVKGDGRTYQLRLSTDAKFRGREMSFRADLPTRKNEWTEVRVPYSEFVGTWRGRRLPDKTFDPSKVRRIGLLIGDKLAGPFDLEIDWIRLAETKDAAE